MVRHPHRAARIAATVLAVALALGGCGIKGPLVPAPRADAAAPDTAKAPARDSRNEPKL